MMALAPVFGLVIVHYQTGVNDAGDPTQQRQQEAQEETEDPAGHQDGDWRKNDTEEVAKGFHILENEHEQEQEY